MITGPLFKWFGSKWLAAKRHTLPKYTHIVEPYAGSAGYSLRYANRKVIICESDKHLYPLWSWLIGKATEGLIREIPINLKEGTDIRDIGLTFGQSLLLKTWQRTNNVGNCWTVSPWGNKPGQWTENTRSRVASEFHEIRHWVVYNFAQIAFKLLEHPATYFVDPPYQYNYDYRAEKPIYTGLALACQRVKGQVIVCEAVGQKNGEVPDWLPFREFGKCITSRRKAENNHHSNELVWEKG